MGTTLQMPYEMWPATREDFQRYWDETVESITEVDPGIPRVPGQADAPALPRAVFRAGLHVDQRSAHAGLPPRSSATNSEWYPSPNQERFFDANNVVLRIASRVTPQAIQVLPFKTPDRRRPVAQPHRPTLI